MAWRWLALLVFLLGGGGCGGGPQQKAMTPQTVRNDGDTYLAGTAIADITPPLHLAIFGHGPEGRVAAGVRARLRCQVFLLASQGELVALVPCDLQSPSFIVQRQVATRLQQLGIPLTADRVFLMATHTHSGPGHYFDAHHYSGTFSSPIPGFDQAVVDLLADRISGAIAEAYASLDRACLGFSVGRLPGLTINRSYAAFLRNDRSGAPALSPLQLGLLQGARDANRRFAEHADGDPADSAPGLSGPEVAVDDQLTVLRIDRQTSTGECAKNERPLGVLAVYGMHPTGAPNTNDLYHGDIFGFATRTAAACLRGAVKKPGRDADSAELSLDEHGANPCGDFDGPAQPNPGDVRHAGQDGPVLVGLANGVEGDVSPKLPYQSVVTARQMGRRLGIDIARAAASIKTLSPTGTLSHFYRELDFRGGKYGPGPDQTLCKIADLGMSSAGGAPDGPTRVRIIPEANPGFRLNQPSGCQTYKMPLRILNTPSPYDYPTVGPIALVRLQLTNHGTVSDSLWFGTMPAEATTMTGFGIRAKLQALANNGPLHQLGNHLALVGLTNQYFQYVATAPEYDFQLYEGASTLYGPHSAEFLAYQFECLARDLSGGTSHCSGSEINAVWSGTPNPPASVNHMPPDDESAPLILPHLDWRRNYRGGALGWEMEFEPLPLVFTKSHDLLKMQLLAGKTGKQVLDDDSGSAFELHEFVENGQTRWRVRWIPYFGPGANPICDQTVRLAVTGRSQFESKPFKVDCNPGTPEGGPL